MTRLCRRSSGPPPLSAPLSLEKKKRNVDLFSFSFFGGGGGERGKEEPTWGEKKKRKGGAWHSTKFIGIVQWKKKGKKGKKEKRGGKHPRWI